MHHSRSQGEQPQKKNQTDTNQSLIRANKTSQIIMLKELFQTFLPGKNMVVNITKSALHCTQKMSENDHRTF